MKYGLFCFCSLTLCILFANTAGAATTATIDTQATQTAVDGRRIENADQEPGSWLTHGRNYAEDRESPLTQITKDNVSQLDLAWYFDTQTNRGLEASPLIIDGVLFTTTSWSQVFAHNAATGELLWKFDPQVPKAWGVNACCDVVNRGVAAWGDAVFVGTLDGRLIALDRKTGKVLWDTLTIDTSRPYTITGAPRAVNGNIIIGNGGADFGVRGYVSAYDALSGKLQWRFHTVPGDPNEPYESDTMRRAAETWTGDLYWKSGGGGTVWDSMAFDPELNLLYIGVGNGSPWNRWVRSPLGGDNLFLSSIVALNPDTGDYVWHYQTTPSDSWDYTATQHMILAELDINGEQRSVLMQAPKNGFFYVLDRRTGELLSADKYVTATWASHVDMETGRPVLTANADHSTTEQQTAPWALGGHNWQPMAFNKATGLVYIPATEAVQPYSTATDFSLRPGGHFNLAQEGHLGKGFNPDGIPPRMLEVMVKKLLQGALIAWDPVAKQERFRIEHDSSWNGGVLTTKAGLVFQGTGDKRLVAYDAATGAKLWQADTGTGIVAPPISYEIDGVQYVAVMAGWGGAGGIALPQAENVNGTSRLLVYKLGGTAQHPIADTTLVMEQAPPARRGSAESIQHGSDLYGEFCSRCHGPAFGAGGAVQDLRYISADTHEIFDAIVLGGAYSGIGMVSFADVLTENDARDVQDYLLNAANDTWEEQNASGWWHDFTNGFYGLIGGWLGGIIAWWTTG